MGYNHEKEGETHIRLSHDSKHPLGRMLYIGEYRPFTDSVHGRFASIIAFCMWYTAPTRLEILRSIHHGNMAHSSLDGINNMSVQDRIEMYRVIKDSIVNDKRLAKELIESILPFVSYGVLQSEHTETKTYDTPWFDWYANVIMQIRQELRS